MKPYKRLALATFGTAVCLVAAEAVPAIAESSTTVTGTSLTDSTAAELVVPGAVPTDTTVSTLIGTALTDGIATSLVAPQAVTATSGSPNTVATVLGTPFTDVFFGATGNNAIFGRTANASIYAYNHQDANLQQPYINNLVGHVFDLYVGETAQNTLNPNLPVVVYPDYYIRQNPVSIVNYGPPNLPDKHATYVLGDWSQTYYQDSKPANLLGSDFLGLNNYGLVWDFNPKYDSIQLHGNPKDYYLQEVDNINVPQSTVDLGNNFNINIGGKISGSAIFSLQKGVPDLVGYVVEPPGTKLDLSASYFQYQGNTPPAGPVQPQITQFGAKSSNTVPLATAVDPVGNVYVTGISDGSFGGPNQSGSYDAWVTKYDKSGNLLWRKQFGGAGYNDSFSIATDKNGNFYLSGDTAGNLFGTKTSSVSDAWLAKYDANGNLIWGKQFGTPGTLATGTRSIAIDSNGDPHISGVVVSYNQNQQAFKFFIRDDSFGAKFDQNTGAQVWRTQFGGPGFNETYNVAVDQNNDTYIGGWTYGLTKAPTGGFLYDAYLTKLDPNGNISWIQQFGTPGYEFPWGLATDSQGNAYISGDTTGNFLLPAGQTDPSANYIGNSATWIAKFLPNGTQAWVKQFGGGTSSDTGQYLDNLVVDSSNNIYLDGFTNGSLGGPNTGSYDAFVAKYNSDGNQDWITQFGTPQITFPSGIALDNNDSNLYVTGYTAGSLGAVNLGGVDGWLAKLTTSSGELESAGANPNIPVPEPSNLFSEIGIVMFAAFTRLVKQARRQNN